MNPITLLLIIGFPAFAGLINLFLKPITRKIWLMFTMFFEGLLIVTAFRVGQGISYKGIAFVEGLFIAFKLDGLGFYMALLAVFLWTMALIYSFSYMKNEKREPVFYTYMLMVLSALIGICLSSNMMILYVFYELLTLSTFPLVIFRGSEEALQLGKKYLLYSFMGSSFVLIGMSIFYKWMGHLDFTLVKEGVIAEHPLMVVSYGFLFLGFGVKSALVPFHSWLPSAMIAPTPVSALLHAVAVVKSGIFGMLRLNYYLFGATFILEHSYLQRFILALITISILTGALLAYHQQNLKKRLAYSTISQLGYIMLGIVMSNGIALLGALLHLMNHALIKMNLFFCVGSMYKNADATEFKQVDGLGKMMPFTFVVFLISSISIMGLPPTNGFVSKWYLAIGVIEQNQIIFIGVILLSAFMSAIYLLPIGINGFFRHNNRETVIPKADIAMRIPMVLLLFFSLFLGLFPNMVIVFLQTHIINALGL